MVPNSELIISTSKLRIQTTQDQDDSPIHCERNSDARLNSINRMINQLSSDKLNQNFPDMMSVTSSRNLHVIGDTDYN